MADLIAQPPVAAVAEHVDAAAEVEKKKKLSLKKNVDPTEFGGPKKPKSAFFLYGDENRDRVIIALKKEAEETGKPFNVAESARKLGAGWKDVSAEQKAVYEAKSKALAEQYAKDLEAWKLTADYVKFTKASALHNKKKADKKNTDAAKESGMPKKPMAAFMLYAQDVRDEVRKELEGKGEKWSIATGGKVTKAKWDALSEDDKAKYQATYEAAKAKFAEDMTAWLETDAGKLYVATKEKNVKRKRVNESNGKAEAKRAKKDAKSGTAATAEGDEDDEDIELSSPDEDAGAVAAAAAAAAPAEVAAPAAPAVVA